jgi:HEAT repeat protein
MKKRRSLLALLGLVIAGLQFAGCRIDRLPPPSPAMEEALQELSGEADAPPRTIPQLREDYRATLDYLIPRIAAKKASERFEPQITLQDVASHAGRPGAEEERMELCAAMIGRLSRETPQPTRVWIVRQLGRVGKAESVPALKQLLRDEDPQLREVARRALENNPAPSASDALRAELKRPGETRWRIGLINALAQRRDTVSVPLFADQLDDSDKSVGAAAAAGLAAIANNEAAEALWAAYESEKGMARSLLAMGRTMASRGERKAAAETFRKLYRSEEAVSVRAAALVGLAACDSDYVSDLALEAMRSEESALQSAAIESARAVLNPKLIRSMAETLSETGPEIQVQTLGLLADRGNSASLPDVIEMLDSSDEPVRVAAAIVVGRIGRPESVDALLEVLTEREGSERKAAEQALAETSGQGVRERLVRRAASGKSETRAAAIKSLASRNDTDALPSLMDYALEDDDAVSRAAFKSLERMAGDDEIPALAKMLVKAKDEDVRQGLEKALKSACGRCEASDAAADLLLPFLKSKNVKSRRALLSALSALGGRTAMEAVVEALSDPNADIRGAAIRSLSDWPDFEAVDDLLVIASDTETNLTHHALAVGGMTRLVRECDEEPVDRRLEAAQAVLRIARRSQEKKKALAALGTVPDAASAETVVALMKEPELRDEAARAALALGKELKDSDPDTVRELAKAVRRLKVSKDMKRQADEMLKKPRK